jgi:hypothetical protein
LLKEKFVKQKKWFLNRLLFFAAAGSLSTLICRGQDGRWPSQARSLTSTLYSERGKREFVDAAGLVELHTRGFEAGVSMGLRAARG